MPTYFAYGSNLDPEQMARRCPSARVVGCATLADHRLAFPRPADDWDDAGVAGIDPTPGETVEGVVYELSDDDLAVLDEYEAIGNGDYRRERVRVTLQPTGVVIELWSYYANPAPDGPFPPSRRYLDALIRGARHHGLPARYVGMLETISTAKDLGSKSST